MFHGVTFHITALAPLTLIFPSLADLQGERHLSRSQIAIFSHQTSHERPQAPHLPITFDLKKLLP